MSSLVIFRRELDDIFSNKKFIAGFLIQILLLLSIVPAFSQYLSQGDLVASLPTMKGFVPLGIVDSSGKADILLQELLTDEELDVKMFDYYPREELEKGEISAILVIPPEYDEGAARVLSLKLVIDQSNLKRGSAFDAIVTSIREASARISEDRKTDFGVGIDEPVQIKKEFLRHVIIESAGTKFSSFFLGYLIPIILFFPVFMSGGVIVDSIVGEKDRKTLEVLLTIPINRRSILTGKLGAILSFIAFQSLLWIALLKVQGMLLGNLGTIFFFLMLINMAVISTAILIAVYSSSVKEANIGMMLFYVFIFISLIVSLSMEYFESSKVYKLIPFVSISRLAVGEDVGSGPLIFLAVFMALYSSIVIISSARLLGRDDIVFGPRPGIIDLISDAVEWASQRFANHPNVGGSAIGFVSGIIAIAPSLILEIFIGIAVLFFLGYNIATIYLMIILFAFVEELMKPFGLYSVARWRPGWISDYKHGFIYGSMAGAGFFAVENLFVAFLTYLTIPEAVINIMTLRIGTTLLLHLTSSGIVGLGISMLTRDDRGRFLFLLAIAGLVHASYNFAVLRVAS